jgi:hypothetical protein
MLTTTATCDGCGTSLDPREEPRDLAHVSGDVHHYCPGCRLLYLPAPTPTRPVAIAEPKRRGA